MQLKKLQAKAKRTSLEDRFLLQIKAMRLPAPEREVMVSSTRKFRFDFAWPGLRIAVEVDGGTWNRGAHGRGVGIRRDCIKSNLATLEGWELLRGTTDMVKDGSLISDLEKLFRRAGQGL